jgi:6-phosphogluconolactonase
LTLIEIEPSLGQGPQNLAVTTSLRSAVPPGGELLLCANMPGNNVAVFRIDPTSGGLTSAGTPIPLKGLFCIMLVP